MDENFIEDFINIGTKSFEDAKAVFELSSKYFLKMREGDYSTENSTFVEGLLHKMICIGENFDLDDDLLNEISQVSKSFVSVFSNPNQNVNHKLPHFNKAFGVSMKFYNAMGKIGPQEEIDFGPFRPGKCDKTNIISLIIEAINLVDSTELINDKTKNRIKESLNNVITELNKPTTDWNIYLRKINHTILVLGALCNIASDVADVSNLELGKEKLEQANLHLQQTSISINNFDIKEVFVINDSISIQPGNVIQLEENK